MKWSPPRIAIRRSVGALGVCVASSILNGCATLPALNTAAGNALTDAEKSQIAAMAARPDFDEPRTRSTAIAATTPVETTKASVTPPASVPLSQPTPAASSTNNTVASTVQAPGPAIPKAEPSKDTKAQPNPKVPSATVTPQTPPAIPGAGVAATNPSATTPSVAAPSVANSTSKLGPASGNPDVPLPKDKAASAETANVSQKTPAKDPPATKPPARTIVTAPKPFAWEQVGRSAGGRQFEIVSAGEEGYRTLVIGSAGGHDPAAIEIVDQLARHLHENSLILGGYETTLIRTLNPDGLATEQVLNAKNVYVNHGFPKSGETPSAEQPAEVGFLLDQLRQLQPQRILHIRSIDDKSGLIAASSGCRKAAEEAAELLGCRVVTLPDKAVAGSMERYLSSRGTSDVMTLAIPAKITKEEAWDRYRDIVLNLIQREDLSTREMARGQDERESADRRGQK